MEADSLLPVAVLLFVAAAAGWFVARLTGRSARRQSTVVPPAEFYRGINHILSDESDKAVALLQSMAAADSGVVEVHLALGTLFRQRGETDRAIRVHQNLLARPDLARSHREQALFALAEDYLKAGLFDRAETLFGQLADQGVRRPAALQRLVSIYERQGDWQQAIRARQRLAELLPGEHDEILAHYHCEIAQRARGESDLAGMRAALRQANRASRGIVRGALMRADLATVLDDLPLALRLYRRILENAPEMAVVVLTRLNGCLEPAAPELGRLVRAALKRQPGLLPHLGRAALATGLTANEALREATHAYVESQPALAALSDSYEHNLDELGRVLRTLGLAKQQFRCGTCGYRAVELHWQCPACREWGSARPDIRIAADPA